MSALPTRDRRAERHAATRDEILDVAWQMVREQGLAALSLRELAHRVGMRAPSLYSYFASKNAIYDAMFAQGAQEFLERNRATDYTGDALHDVRAGLRTFIEFCTEDPSRYQLLFQRTVPGFEPSADSFAISVQGLSEVRARLEAVGITDPTALDLLTAIGAGLADQQISNDPGGQRWTRLVDEAAVMFIAHQTSKQRPKKRGRR